MKSRVGSFPKNSNLLTTLGSLTKSETQKSSRTEIMSCLIAYWIVTFYVLVSAPAYVVADHDAALLKQEQDSSASRTLSNMFLCPDDEYRELGSRQGRRHEKKVEYKNHKKNIKTIREISVNSELNILVEALKITGLLDMVLDPSVDLTVFAPTDMAFSDLGEEKLKELLDTPAVLREILLYHVVSCTVTSEDLVALGSPITVPTLSEDSTLEVTIRTGKIFVKGDGNVRNNLPQVIEADVRASNGVIHVIDAVILPGPSTRDLPTIAEVGESINEITAGFLNAQITGLDMLTGDPNRELTAFAPTNEAVERLGKDISDYLVNNTDILKLVLLYHIAEGTIRSEMLVGMDCVHTLLDQSFGVELMRKTVSLQGKANTEVSEIKKVDIEASNGVIHVIDRVLIPILPIGATAAFGGFSLLTTALEVTGLSAVLNDVNKPVTLYTVFAPTDAAFQAIGEENLNSILGNTKLLEKILLTHVLGDVRLDSTAVLNAVPVSLTMLSGSKIKVFQGKSKMSHGTRKGVDALLIKGPGNRNPAEVVATDIDAINGIIHVLDRVLLAGPSTRDLPTIAEVGESINEITAGFLNAQITGLDMLTGDPNRELTAFAPTNEAVERLGKDISDYLVNNTDILKLVLLYHIAEGTIRSEMLVGMDCVHTLLDQSFGVELMRKTVSLQGKANTEVSEIKKVDIEASNGVIHVIDRVLIPILPIGATAAFGGFSLLTTALEVTGLSAVLNDVNKPVTLYTAFAPTDAAFQAIGEENLNSILGNTKLLEKILLTHVLGDVRLDSTAVLNAVPVSLTMLSGSKIKVFQGKSKMSHGTRKGVDALLIKGPGNRNPAEVVATDIDAINGIIHVLDRVLLP